MRFLIISTHELHKTFVNCISNYVLQQDSGRACHGFMQLVRRRRQDVMWFIQNPSGLRLIPYRNDERRNRESRQKQSRNAPGVVPSELVYCGAIAACGLLEFLVS